MFLQATGEKSRKNLRNRYCTCWLNTCNRDEMKGVEVIARWDGDGKPFPTRFFWNETEYYIVNIGRSWENEDGLHILCEVEGGQVFELIYHKEWGWSIGKKPDTLSLI